MASTQTRYFDPSEMVRGIQQLLVSDNKKVAFLFGDGTQSARRKDRLPHIPAASEIIQIIETVISQNRRLAPAFADIKTELTSSAYGFTVETLLANIDDKIRMIGNQTLNNLNKDDFLELSSTVKGALWEAVSVHRRIRPSDTKQIVHYDFAKWVKNADKKQAVEVFTTNYDYLFEIGLEEMEVPYYDGFSGSYRPFFNPASLTDMNYLKQQTKIWKINGSLGLGEMTTEDGALKIIRSGSESDEAPNLLIYSSAQKYSNSKRTPYSAYLDRLYYFVKQNDAVLFICGYSFNDERINERILSAINVSSTSHVYVFADDIGGDENSESYTNRAAQIALSNRRITVMGAKNSIIGCARGAWRLKREPDSRDSEGVKTFFDYFPPSANITEKGETKTWTGEGEFKLHEFTHFVDFLKNTIPKNEWEA